jgi:hypothetical protein
VVLTAHFCVFVRCNWHGPAYMAARLGGARLHVRERDAHRGGGSRTAVCAVRSTGDCRLERGRRLPIRRTGLRVWCGGYASACHGDSRPALRSGDGPGFPGRLRRRRAEQRPVRRRVPDPHHPATRPRGSRNPMVGPALGTRHLAKNHATRWCDQHSAPRKIDAPRRRPAQSGMAAARPRPADPLTTRRQRQTRVARPRAAAKRVTRVPASRCRRPRDGAARELSRGRVVDRAPGRPIRRFCRPALPGEGQRVLLRRRRAQRPSGRSRRLLHASFV